MDDEQAALEPVVKRKEEEKKGLLINTKKNKNSDSEDLSDEEILGKTDDPVRIILEMGGVELLSREGEIAIAKE